MIHITNHKDANKMQHFISISTSARHNDFCRKMSENKELICSKCYSLKLEWMKTLRTALLRNHILAERELEENEIPFLNAAYVRFNSFGELINETHLLNLYKIAEKNKHATFGLFTKRYDLVMKLPKQSNIVYIASSPKLNEAVKNQKVIDFFDKTFTVYSKDYALENSVIINCGKLQCFKCLKCYTLGNKEDISELLK